MINGPSAGCIRQTEQIVMTQINPLYSVATCRVVEGSPVIILGSIPRKSSAGSSVR
jgi:hypothetical protein